MITRFVSLLCIMVVQLSCTDSRGKESTDQLITPAGVEIEKEVLAAGRNSPTKLLTKNTDGTLLIKINPRIYIDQMGCDMISTGHGMTSQMYYVFSYEINERYFYSIWGVTFGKKPPFDLDKNVEYEMLIKPLWQPKTKKESVQCEILKIRVGGLIKYEK